MWPNAETLCKAMLFFTLVFGTASLLSRTMGMYYECPYISPSIPWPHLRLLLLSQNTHSATPRPDTFERYFPHTSSLPALTRSSLLCHIVSTLLTLDIQRASWDSSQVQRMTSLKNRRERRLSLKDLDLKLALAWNPFPNTLPLRQV